MPNPTPTDGPYFADPLLAKWAAECSDVTRQWIDGESQTDPLTLLSLLDGGSEYPSILVDFHRLKSLILAELSGARRARERAEFWAKQAEEFDDGFGRAVGQILEALNGE